MSKRRKYKGNKKGGGSLPPFFDGFKAETVGDAVILCFARELLARRFPEIPKFKYAKITWILVSNVELNALAAITETPNAEHKTEDWKTAASGFEARVGKLFLEKGYSAARRFLEPLFMARFDISAMAAQWKKPEKLNAIYKIDNGNFTQTENKSVFSNLK